MGYSELIESAQKGVAEGRFPPRKEDWEIGDARSMLYFRPDGQGGIEITGYCYNGAANVDKP